MNLKVSARVLAVAVAAGSLATISLATPSGAVSKVSCSKEVSGKPSATSGIITVKATLSGCVGGLGATATDVSTVNTKTAKATSKTTWAGGKGTTIQSVKYATQKTPGKCPTGDARLLVTATTTGGTGAAAKAIPKGSVGKSSICENTKTSIGTLEPGTKSTF